jgi:type I restriction enzyme, S subunit
MRFHSQKLKYCCTLRGRIGWQNLRSEEFTEEGPYLITGMHFSNGDVDWERCFHITQERYAIDSNIHVYPGDLLITKDGSIGKLAYIDAIPGAACLNSHLLIIRPKRDGPSSRYLFYLLQSEQFQRFILEEQSGTTFYGISQESIENFPALLPCPNTEQDAIAKFLDYEIAKIDELIGKRERMVELLEEKRSSLTRQVVTQGLNPTVTKKDSGVPWLGEIPSNWTIRKLGHFCSVGNGSTPSREERSYWQGGDYPWLNSACVNSGIVDTADQFVTPLALAECHLPIVSPNSVLVAITGQGKTRGRSALLRIEATINQHLAFIAPRGTTSAPEFLNAVLNGCYSVLRVLSDGGGSTKGALTCEDLKQFKVPIPPLGEQQQILRDLDRQLLAIHHQMRHCRRQAELLAEYRQSLITAAVTGQLDIREHEKKLEALA